MMNGEIKGDLVTLRILKEAYFKDYIMMFSHRIKVALHVSSTQSELEYLQEELEKIEQGLTFFYCIFDNLNGLLIGAVEIRSHEYHNGQLYCWLHENYWGTGRFQEAIRLASQEYFKVTGQTYFNALVDADNKRSYHALKKSGFAPVGLHKGPRGKQYDLVFRKK